LVQALQQHLAPQKVLTNLGFLQIQDFQVIQRYPAVLEIPKDQLLLGRQERQYFPKARRFP